MNSKKSLITWAVLTLIAFACMFLANVVQTDSGKIELIEGKIEVNDLGNMYYKLYKPVTATSDDPAPAVLLLHGYQNDHETCAAYAIELARRGFVVMALDEYGHGRTDVGLINRGFVNHKVTVNYGQDSAVAGTYVTIKGADRYKLMMNFSNLSFFNDHYSKDPDGNSILDSSCGGSLAYGILSMFSYVDSSRMGVSGHSMGTWSSWSVAADWSGTDIEPKAVVLQCGELFTDDCYDAEKIHFNNVLLLQAKYDEFSYFRDYRNVVDDELIHSDLRAEFLGTTKERAAWNTTFGSFANNSARRIQLLNTNHRLTTHNAKGLATALQWFQISLKQETSLDPADQRFMIKECLVLAAMICTLFAIMPLMSFFLSTRVFSGLVQELPSSGDSFKTGFGWIGSALLTIILAGASYPFMTQLGHGLLPLPENIFRMTIGNGFVSYYGLLIVIMLLTGLSSAVKARKNEIDGHRYHIGLASESHPNGLGLGLFLLALVLSVILVGYVYGVVFACEQLFQLDLRFIWPFFKSFTADRAFQFLVYLPLYAVYFILNNSKCIAAMRTGISLKKGFFPFLLDWIKNAFVMTGGVIAVALVEYIPFFNDIGPGADLFFGSTFGGPFMSLLILFLPQILIFSIISTFAYRRSGNVYTGGLVSAMLACWIVTGGSSML